MDKKIIAVKQSIQDFISTLGITLDVPLGRDIMTRAIMITKAGLDRLGIDLNEIFQSCPKRKTFDEKTDLKNGILVNLDMFQVAALLKAIISKRPDLKDKLGLYNMSASNWLRSSFTGDRYGTFNIKELEGVRWVWTGEMFINFQPEDSYPEPYVVTFAELEFLTKAKSVAGWTTAFIYRAISAGEDRELGGMQAYDRDNSMGVIFGLRI